MNSSFTVTDLGGYSPLDYTTTAWMKTSDAAAATAAARGNKATATDEWKVFVEPSVLGRRVDPVTRRVSPTVTPLPIEPHSFTLTMEPVTDRLLAREEKERDKEMGINEVDAATTPAMGEGRRREGLKRPHPTSSPATESASGLRRLSNGVPPEKRLKVIRPSTAASPAVHSTAPSVSQSGPVASTGAAVSQPDTALVRLSSGKIVRVPIEILKQHQAQIRARQQQQQQQQQLLGQTTLLSNANGIRLPDTALSRVLASINSTMGGTSTTTTMPTVIRHPQVVYQQQPQALIRQIRPQPLTQPLPGIFTNGIRLPQRPHLPQQPLLQQQQRVIRIRAYQGPTPSVSLGGQTVTVSANGTAKLSDRLSFIEPVAISSPQHHRIVTTLSGGGQPVRVRCYQGPGSTSTVTSSSLDTHRLSVALNSMAGQHFQTVTSMAPSTQQKTVLAPIEGVIVLGPKQNAQLAQQQQHRNGGGQIAIGGQIGLGGQQKVQLAPIFGRKAVVNQASPVRVSSQQAFVIRQMPPTGGNAAAGRSVQLVEVVQHPGKPDQLIALGGGQMARAGGTHGVVVKSTSQPPPMPMPMHQTVKANVTIPSSPTKAATQ